MNWIGFTRPAGLLGFPLALALNVSGQSVLTEGVELGWMQFEQGLAPSVSFQGVVASDGITAYVASTMEGQANSPLAVRAMDLLDGTERWQSVAHSNFGDQSTTTALLVAPNGESVYSVGSLLGEPIENAIVQSLNATDGTQLWSTPIGSIFGFAPQAAQLSPDGSLLYLVGSSVFGMSLYALDTVSGTADLVLFFQELPSMVCPTDLVVNPDGTRLWLCGSIPGQSFANTEYLVVAVDLPPGQPGQIAWEQSYGELDSGFLTAQSLEFDAMSGRLFVGGNRGNLTDLDEVLAYDGATGELAWSASVGFDVERVELASDGRVVVAGMQSSGASASALDPVNGTVAWSVHLGELQPSSGPFVDFAISPDRNRLELLSSETLVSINAPDGSIQRMASVAGSTFLPEALPGAIVLTGSGPEERTLFTAVQTFLNTAEDTVVSAYTPVGVDPEWTQAFDLPVPGNDRVDDLAISNDRTKIVAVVETTSAGFFMQASHLVAFDSSDGSQIWGGGAFASTGFTARDRRVQFSPDDDRVVDFFTTPFGFHLSSRSASDGELIWQTTFDLPDGIFAFDPANSLAIAPDGSRIFALARQLDILDESGLFLLALDSEGEPVWTFQDSPHTPSFASNPLPTANALACAPDSSTVFLAENVRLPEAPSNALRVGAFDSLSGTPLWSSLLEKSQPLALLVGPAGSDLFVVAKVNQPADGAELLVAALNASNGQILWTTTFGADDGAAEDVVFATLDNSEHSVLVGSHLSATSGNPSRASFLAFDQGTGDIRWSTEVFLESSSVFHGAFDPATRTFTLGGQVLVQAPFQAPSQSNYVAFGVDAGTGLQLWQAEVDLGFGSWSQATRVVAGPGQFFLAGSASTPTGSDVHVVELQSAPLTATPSELSISFLGEQLLVLFGGSALAGQPYIMLGSATGGSPGIPLGPGIVLPLAPDAYFDLLLSAQGGGLLQNSTGVLDDNGRATATFHLPAGIHPSLAGLSLLHAYVVFPDFVPVFASPSVSLELTD